MRLFSSVVASVVLWSGMIAPLTAEVTTVIDEGTVVCANDDVMKASIADPSTPTDDCGMMVERTDVLVMEHKDSVSRIRMFGEEEMIEVWVASDVIKLLSGQRYHF